jgi:hypothetical protein
MFKKSGQPSREDHGQSPRKKRRVTFGSRHRQRGYQSQPKRGSGVDMNVHIKGGMVVVVEAGMQLSLKAGANFIDIGPAGISIQGTMVNINMGGAAGSGSGAQAASPSDPNNPDAGHRCDGSCQGRRRNRATPPRQLPLPPCAQAVLCFRNCLAGGRRQCLTNGRVAHGSLHCRFRRRCQRQCRQRCRYRQRQFRQYRLAPRPAGLPLPPMPPWPAFRPMQPGMACLPLPAMPPPRAAAMATAAAANANAAAATATTAAANASSAAGNVSGSASAQPRLALTMTRWQFWRFDFICKRRRWRCLYRCRQCQYCRSERDRRRRKCQHRHC